MTNTTFRHTKIHRARGKLPGSCVCLKVTHSSGFVPGLSSQVDNPGMNINGAIWDFTPGSHITASDWLPIMHHTWLNPLTTHDENTPPRTSGTHWVSGVMWSMESRRSMSCIEQPLPPLVFGFSCLFVALVFHTLLYVSYPPSQIIFHQVEPLRSHWLSIGPVYS